MKKDGGWIFISHSHQDIQVVRKIRNRFEALGYEPLMFYLKCLNDHDEITDLIRREIDEREWFVYVDSENARSSAWVKSERKYIAGLQGKKVMTIDMNGDVLQQADQIARSLKVYIAYSAADRSLAQKISDALTAKDYLVIQQDENIRSDGFAGSWDMIESAANDGFVIVLVSQNSGRSSALLCEVNAAQKNNAKIIPVYVDDASLTPELMFVIGELQGVRISSEPGQQELEKILQQIEHRVDFYRSDFTMSAGFLGARTIHYPYVATIPAYTFWDCTQLERVYIPNCVTYISDKAFSPEQDVLILCQQGSYAESYCRLHDRRMEIVASADSQ